MHRLEAPSPVTTLSIPNNGPLIRAGRLEQSCAGLYTGPFSKCLVALGDANIGGGDELTSPVAQLQGVTRKENSIVPHFLNPGIRHG